LAIILQVGIRKLYNYNNIGEGEDNRKGEGQVTQKGIIINRMSYKDIIFNKLRPHLRSK
jgi:hypothetical protein